jgi:hypothetical protein
MINIHKIAALAAALTSVLSLSASPAMAFSVGETNNTEILKKNLLGINTVGLSDFSVSVTGNNAAFGTFTNDPFGLTSGVVISTGKVTNIPGQNRKHNLMIDGTDLNTDFGIKGEAGDLTQLNLSFFADCTVEKLLFEYVFASEEFPEFGGSKYNDNFELLLNGTNLAKLSDGKTVTINNLVPDPHHRSTDHRDYINNPTLTGIAASIIKLDGFTKILGFEGFLKQNQTNVLSIRVQDVGDGNLDSAVFIKGGSVETAKTEAVLKPKAVLIKNGSVETVKAEPVPEPMTVGGLMAGGAMLAAGRKLRRRQ